MYENQVGEVDLGLYLDISIDLMVIGREDAHLLSQFKVFNEK